VNLATRLTLVVLALALGSSLPGVPAVMEPPASTSAPSGAEVPPVSPLDAIRADLLALKFESALAAVESLLRDPALPEATRLEALGLRSQAHAATGALDTAEQDYREILELDAAFEPDAAVASRKALARFQKVRAERVGMLRLTLDPPDALVLADGRPARRLDAGLLPVLAGSRVLRFERKGFDPLEQKIDVEPGKESPLDVRLVPNVRSIVVRTEPDDVEVTLDGNPAGATARAKSGPADAPAELLVEALAPGEHTITLSKPCFRTVRHRRMITVDLMDHAALSMEPVTLDAARSRLTLKGEIPGAEVRVDAQPLGSLPLEPLDLCPGTREIEVRAGGRVVWWGRVELSEDGEREIQIRPRPNLYRLAAEWPVAFEPFAQAFSSRPPDLVPASADLTSLDGWEAVPLPAATDLAMAVLPAQAGRPAVRSVLYSPLLRTVERIDGAAPDPTRPAWQTGLTGMRLADSRAWGKAVVVEVVPDGPAAAAGVSVGDRVVGVGPSKVESSRQAVSALRSVPEGSEIEVRLVGPASAPRTVRIRTTPSPVLSLATNDDRSPAVVAAWAAADGASAGIAASSALANLALLLSRAGRHDLAAEALRRVPWGDRKGIGAGTGAYLLGRELLAQGLEAEARAAFRRARESSSTAGDDEGLPVAPAAADHLVDLGVGQEPAPAIPTGR
jgi:tetratricopeptide (TPR) repeat protein